MHTKMTPLILNDDTSNKQKKICGHTAAANQKLNLHSNVHSFSDARVIRILDYIDKNHF